MGGEAAPPIPPTVNFTKAQMDSFEKFEGWLQSDAPNVAKMKNPFTIDQYLKLAKDYKADVIKELILKMDNWKELNKKNTYAYRTFLNWSKNEFNNKTGDPAKIAASETDEILKKLIDGSQH